MPSWAVLGDLGAFLCGFDFWEAHAAHPGRAKERPAIPAECGALESAFFVAAYCLYINQDVRHYLIDLVDNVRVMGALPGKNHKQFAPCHLRRG